MNLYHERLLLGEAVGDLDPDNVQADMLGVEMLEDLIWRDGDEIVILDRETGEIERIVDHDRAED